MLSAGSMIVKLCAEVGNLPIHPNKRDFAIISVFLAPVLNGGIGDSGVVGIVSVLVFVNTLEDNPGRRRRGIEDNIMELGALEPGML